MKAAPSISALFISGGRSEERGYPGGCKRGEREEQELKRDKVYYTARGRQGGTHGGDPHDPDRGPQHTDHEAWPRRHGEVLRQQRQRGHAADG